MSKQIRSTSRYKFVGLFVIAVHLSGELRGLGQPAEEDPDRPEAIEARVRSVEQAPAKAAPEDGVGRSPELSTRTYRLEPEIFGDAVPSRDGSRPQQVIRNLLTSEGTDLSRELTDVFFNDRTGVLLVRATRDDLAIIDEVIQHLHLLLPQISQSDRSVLEGSEPTRRGPPMGDGAMDALDTTAPSVQGARSPARPLAESAGPVDRGTLQSGSEPKENLLLTIQKTNQGRHLTWNAKPGAVYQVQASHNLKNWENVGKPRVASKETDSIPLEPDERTFFRVVRLE